MSATYVTIYLNDFNLFIVHTTTISTSIVSSTIEAYAGSTSPTMENEEDAVALLGLA